MGKLALTPAPALLFVLVLRLLDQPSQLDEILHRPNLNPCVDLLIPVVAQADAPPANELFAGPGSLQRRDQVLGEPSLAVGFLGHAGLECLPDVDLPLHEGDGLPHALLTDFVLAVEAGFEDGDLLAVVFDPAFVIRIATGSPFLPQLHCLGANAMHDCGVVAVEGREIFHGVVFGGEHGIVCGFGAARRLPIPEIELCAVIAVDKTRIEPEVGLAPEILGEFVWLVH